MTGAGVSVIRAEDEHAGVLAEFYREVWDRNATPEGVLAARRRAAAANPANPGEPPPTFLFLAEGRAVGHVTSIPVRLWDGERERPAHWIKGLMVLPEHRRGPVGFLVLKEAVRQLAGGPTMAMVVAPEARRLFGALGFADVGALPNELRLLRPGRIIRRVDIARLGMARLPGWALSAARAAQSSPLAPVAGAGVRLGMGLWSLARGRAPLPTAACALGDTARLDRAWLALRAGVSAAPARTGSSVRLRYREEGEGAYECVELKGEEAGYALVRRARTEGGDPRLNGLRVATLSELVAPLDRPAAVLSLLAAAERVAAADGADALLATASHPALRSLLRRRAYLPLPGNVHFLLRDAAGGDPLPRTLDQWWLMRGDSAADDVF
jgi:hypothetical protein